MLADEHECYLALLIDKKKARLFVVYMGEIEEHSDFMDEWVPHPKAGGQQAEKHQRHHDMHVLWHVKHPIDVAEKLFAREQCHWLVIGGPQETLAELRNNLPKALAERLAGEISLSVDAPADDVLKEVLEVERTVERRIEAQQVDALLTAALGQGAGVLGLDDTLRAIVEGAREVTGGRYAALGVLGELTLQRFDLGA
jgi:peptide chain release factor subunit 1